MSTLSLIGLIIPTLFAIFLYLFYDRKVVWWEFLILFAVSLASVGIVKLIADNSNTKDIEYWNGTKDEVQYYEPWDEEVPCTHSYSCNCTTDSKGNESCSTCYMHPYDVDYHPAEWTLVTSIGNYSISENEYNRLVTKFGNKSFVNMNRDYHSINGNMYKAVWPRTDITLEGVTEKRSYENRPKASNSVFSYPTVDSTDRANYKLYDHPEVYGLVQKHILGYGDQTTGVAEHQMECLNGRLGPVKEIACFIMIFRNKTERAAELQEAYWHGGNKNEFSVCIGLDAANNVLWCKCFSWSEVAEPKITIRNFVTEMKVLNLSKVVTFMTPELTLKYKRKHFRDFNYLSIPMTSGQLIAALITTIIIDIGIAFFVVLNDVEDTDDNVEETINLKKFCNNIRKFFINIVNKFKSVLNKK